MDWPPRVPDSLRAMPKSPSLKKPNSLMKMFSGLMSRWMICFFSQISSAEQMSMPRRMTSASERVRVPFQSLKGVSSSMRM